ncbi:hypothetical protein AQUCO_00500164v1 [Aquilegia coerulea]|uniref:F-box domain-containing protein n=1 Tax=Aquilegia coerulea TaxID=218851 RepID=A0A2G5EQP9_AQUCA|nr:hypothetical protein AQUCO_00500164v1 [Aquilegia coerulea]
MNARDSWKLRRCDVASSEEVKDKFSNDDIAIEILSRLSIASVMELKCVCKRWCEILSSPSFRSAHFQRSARSICGIFVQATIRCLCCEKCYDYAAVYYASVGKEGPYETTKKILDFLPEKVVVLASSNGVLFCRTIFEEYNYEHLFDRTMITDDRKHVVLYVCNPITKEWTALKPRGRFRNDCCYGFSYNPLGSSVTNPGFEVVMVQPSPRIYSSKTGKWRTSNEVCTLSKRLHLHHGCFTNGVFYWRTSDHSILTFDLKQERSQVIRLPGHMMTGKGGLCLGVSEGNLHYINFNMLELLVWVLEMDALEPKWALKHSKPLVEIDDAYKSQNYIMYPYGFHDDIVFLRVHWYLCTYNIKTGKMEDALFSFCNLQRFPRDTSYRDSLQQELKSSPSKRLNWKITLVREIGTYILTSSQFSFKYILFTRMTNLRVLYEMDDFFFFL